MPGIVVSTDRARYYSLYLWILWHVAREEPANRQRLLAGFRRREAAVAYSTLIHDEQASVEGKIVASKNLAAAGDDIQTEVRVLPSSEMGGYGQYYSGSLYGLRLTHRPDGLFDQVTEGFATEIAEAVDHTVSKTPYVSGRWFSRNRVDMDVLRSSAKSISLDAIRRGPARRERELLIKLFFARRDDEESSRRSWRRLSLLRILSLLRECERSGYIIERDRLDEQLLYAPVYFEAIVADRRRLRAYRPPAGLAECALRWRQFCVHEYLTWAVESILSALLEVLAAEGGLCGAVAAEKLVGGAFSKTLHSIIGTAPRPHVLLSLLGVTKVPDAASCAAARKAWPLAGSTNEMMVVNLETEGPQETTAAAVVMLALLFVKWRGADDDAAFAEVGQSAGREIAGPTFLRRLDGWLAPEAGWRESVEGILDFIVQNHDRVMYEKQRLESCWIETSADRYTQLQDYVPQFRASRHAQAVCILEDLLLVAESKDGGLRLTSEGESVLDLVGGS